MTLNKELSWQSDTTPDRKMKELSKSVLRELGLNKEISQKEFFNAIDKGWKGKKESD